MTIFEAVRGFLAEAPGVNAVDTDLAAPGDERWALTEQEDTVVQESITGGKVRRRRFLVHFRAGLDSEAGRQDNHRALEALSRWVDAQTAAGVLPGLPEPWNACALTAEGAVLKRTEDGRSGLYQMPMVLTYEKEGE